MVMAFYDVLIDDFSNNSMFFSFSPEEEDVSSDSYDIGIGNIMTSSTYDNDSDLLGELSETTNTTEESTDYAETSEFDFQYDSDL